MLCPRCNSENTQEKEITAKTGKKYMIWECLNGCKNEKNEQWNYSWFPPRKSDLIEQRLCALEDRVLKLEAFVKTNDTIKVNLDDQSKPPF